MHIHKKLSRPHQLLLSSPLFLESNGFLSVSKIGLELSGSESVPNNLPV